MARGCLRLMLVLAVGFVLPILAIRAQPFDGGGLATFLAQTACLPPCLLGIVPEDTALYEAHLRLQAHAWIGQVESNENVLLGEPTTLRWAWNGQQPDFLGASGHNTVYSHNGILVDEVQVAVDLPLGAVWLTLGPPDAYRLALIGGSGGDPNHYLAFISLYDEPDFAILGIIDCPYYAGLWNAPTAIRVRLTQTFPEPDLASSDSLPRRVAALEQSLC